MRIFIAEKSPVIQQRLQEMLTEIAGVYLVGISSNVNYIIELIQATNPDVLIIDSDLFSNNITRVLSKIRKYYSTLVLIVFVDDYLDQYKKQAWQFRVDYFLTKSHEFFKITEIIQKLSIQQQADQAIPGIIHNKFKE
ncbi:MAG TPA: response regulator [bacterium]|nr:response regulator [bacterium]HPN43955.1 response regulator [bacterium]